MGIHSLIVVTGGGCFTHQLRMLSLDFSTMALISLALATLAIWWFQRSKQVSLLLATQIDLPFP